MKTGHTAPGIWQVPYAPATPVAMRLPVELLSFADLRAMDATGRRRRPQRPSFHVLAVVERGHGTHCADFVDRPLQPRTVVHLRPGVVHRWTDVEQVDGSLVLFTEGAADVDPDSGGAASSTRVLGPERWELLQAATSHLRCEYADALRSGAGETPPALRHTLMAWLVRAGTANEAEPASLEHGIFRSYRMAVEEHHKRWRHVSDYAARIGCSSRTLSRATFAATGVGAKQFLDERVMLEAKRLLAHTDITVAQLAGTLGFTQPANFTAFFTSHAGTAPTRWRNTESGGTSAP